MDIKAKISELTDKVKKDPSFAEKFKKDPIKAVESVLGVDLPDEKIKEIAEAVKAKVNLGSIGDKIGGIFKKK